MVFFRSRYFFRRIISFRATYLSHLISALLVAGPSKDIRLQFQNWYEKWNDHAKFRLIQTKTTIWNEWKDNNGPNSNETPLSMSMKYLYCRSSDKLVWQSQVIVIMSLNNSHLPPINLVWRCILFVLFYSFANVKIFWISLPLFFNRL